MMRENFAVILALVCVGITLIALFLSIIIYQINRKKGIVSLILVIIFAAITGYYLYLTVAVPPFSETGSQKYSFSTIPSVSPGSEPAMVIFETEDGSQIKVEDDDHLEIKKDVRIKATEVTQNGKKVENVRINVIGFAPSDNPSTTDDTGYFFSYKNMIKRFAIDDEKTLYKVEVKKDGDTIAEVFLKFI